MNDYILIVGNLRNVPIPEDKDIVVISNGIEFTEDDVKILQEVAYIDKNIGMVCYDTLHIFSKYKTPRRIIAPFEGAVYIKNKILAILDLNEYIPTEGFDFKLKYDSDIIKDLALRATQKGFSTLCISHAGFKVTEKFKMQTEYDSRLESKWRTHYFNIIPNMNIINAIKAPKDALIKVLEVGCDMGATLLEIKNLYPYADVYGLDISAEAANIAKACGIKANCTDIDSSVMFYNIQFDFDYIIYGDVLEHLKDPNRVLKSLRVNLKNDGVVIASIPNLTHISVMREILSGHFTYTESGLLDKTHIHFFTKKEIEKMFNETGYEIKSIESLQAPISKEDDQLINWLMTSPVKGSDKVMYKTFQYLCTAIKK